MKSVFGFFLIEIRLEDEFLEVEIRFRILLQNPKSEFQKVNQNFPIEHAHSHLDTSSLKLANEVYRSDRQFSLQLLLRFLNKPFNISCKAQREELGLAITVTCK